MVDRSNSSTHLNSSDIINVLPIPTVNHKSSSFTNLTFPPPQTTDYDPGKQARRSVRRLSIDIERLRLKKDLTTLCTTKRRNSVCRSACDLSRSGLYDDLKSLKTQRNECVQKQKSDKIAVPCTTTTKLTIPQVNDIQSNDSEKLPSLRNEGLEVKDKKLPGIHCSLPLNRLSLKSVKLLSIKSNNANEKLKILCLYCDRTFSSQTLHAKHSERVHEAPEGRRLSTRKSNSSSLLYPGCSHCHNGKTTSVLHEELPALFHHLIDIHFDKYFACKPCTLRFPSKETLQVHLDQLHKDTKPSVSSMGISDKRKKRFERCDKESVTKDVSQPLSIVVDIDENYDDKKHEGKSSSDEPILRSSRRQLANRLELIKTSSPRKRRMLRNEETILSRLGITQNRSPRTRRGLKARSEIVRAETPIMRPNRNKNTRSTNNSSSTMVEGIETRSTGIAKVELLSSTFDENFYKSVSSNVRKNLCYHLDGKMQSGPMSPSPISPVDPVPTVRSTLVKSSLVADSEIHEATAISALTAFPTLLTSSQYGAEPMPIGKIKKPITKNSWKWKWDCVKKYKYVNEGGKVVKKVKQPVAGIRDLSKLDMWTQLTMRTKHELVRKQEMEITGEIPKLAGCEAAREDKRILSDQLNKILDARILPQINLEQNDQRVIKLEPFDNQCDAIYPQMEAESQQDVPTDNLLTMLQLTKRPVTTKCSDEERVLSGEWARPRCYICYGCGEKFENMRRLQDHKNNYHQHVYSTHYEIVGKELIEGDLFRHFYIPSVALRKHSERLNVDRKSNAEVEDSMDSVMSYPNSCSKSDSFDTDSYSRNSKVSAISMITSVASLDELSVIDVSAELKKTCTKCKRSYNTMGDLHRHMLDCSGDYDWFLAKKRHNIKYRYFGSRRRKINRPNFGNRRPIRPKKEESETPRIRDVHTPKPRPSDAESIQRMLANLPAKRVCRQIFPNLQAKKRVRKFMPANNMVRNRQQLHLTNTKTKTNRNFKFIAATQTTANAIRKNISRRLRFISANTGEKGRSTRTPRKAVELPLDVNSDSASTKSKEIVKKIGRNTKKIFPKLSNSLRQTLQKRNLRNPKNGKGKTGAKETNSIVERKIFRKSKRVQVTLRKLGENNVVDKVKLEDKKEVEHVEEEAPAEKVDEIKIMKAPVKKRVCNKFKKSIKGKYTRNKNTNEKNETSIQPIVTVKMDVEEVKQEDQEKCDIPVIPIDESSQSSSPSDSSKRSKRGSFKKQKLIQTDVVAPAPKEEVVEINLPVEPVTLFSQNRSDVSGIIPLEIVVPVPITEEPMDLSTSKPILSVPAIQEPMKTPPTKRRTRKLNDCIAMLTGKLQEKLGVPFLNSETSILLSPSSSHTIQSSKNSEKDIPPNSSDDVEYATAVEPDSPITPIKESSSNHSTPTRRGSRKGRSINFDRDELNRSPKSVETKVIGTAAVASINNNIDDATPSDIVSKEILDCSQLIDSGIEINVSIAESVEIDLQTEVDVSKEVIDIEVQLEDVETNVDILNEVTDVGVKVDELLQVSDNSSKIIRCDDNVVSDNVKEMSQCKQKIGNTKSRAKMAKRQIKGKKKQPEKLVDEVDVVSETEAKSIPEESIIVATATKKPKRKKSKKNLLLETIPTQDTAEQRDLKSLNTVVKRQKKSLGQIASSPVSGIVNKVSLSTSAYPIEATNETSVKPRKVASKLKRGRGKTSVVSEQADHANELEEIVIEMKSSLVNSKTTKSPSVHLVEQSLKSHTPANSEETISDFGIAVNQSVKEVKKLRKRKNDKKCMMMIPTSVVESAESKITEDIDQSKTSNDTTNLELHSDEEMHPWDPEIGFVTINSHESTANPTKDSTPLSDQCNDIDEPSLQSIKAPDENLTNAASTVFNDTKSSIKKKRRKNELAKILADQLLESFKEVDKSRIQELKLLHDLSIESKDDLLFTTSLSRTPPPKRRTAANIRSDALVDLDTSLEEQNSNEDTDVDVKTTTKRKKAVDGKRGVQNVKLVKRKKMIGPKLSKKLNKKRSNDISSSGYLSDSEICQTKKPVTLRRRLTMCDEYPKRLSRNSKETEVPASLFDSIKKRKNSKDTTLREPSGTKLKTPPKISKKKIKRNLLQQITDHTLLNSSDKIQMISQETVDEQHIQPIKSSFEKFDDSGKETTAVNDLVTQIINDFTTSTLNSPTTSPILFGDISKSKLSNTATTKLSTVLNNKKNVLNGEILSNGFKSDVSKEISFATLSQPLKNQSVEHIRSTDNSSLDVKQPLRAPFMSPRWEQTDEWNSTPKLSQNPTNDLVLHKLWTLNNKDEKLSTEKCNKEKTKKLGKISKKKARKHEGILNNKKVTPAVVKRPLLRPSILSVGNAATKVDIAASENCLKKLESSSLFLGKICNFENDSISKIFVNEKTSQATTENKDNLELVTSNELFGRKYDMHLIVNNEIEADSNILKKPRNSKKIRKVDVKEQLSLLNALDNTTKRKISKLTEKQKNSKPTDVLMGQSEAVNESSMSQVIENNFKDGVEVANDNADKIVVVNRNKRRKMDSAKRKDTIILAKNLLDNANQSDDDNVLSNYENSSIKGAKNVAKEEKTPNLNDRSYESSQNTILSEIVNKIRDANKEEATESDEDLSLAEIAKNMNNKISNLDQFSDYGIAESIQQSESLVNRNDLSTVVTVLRESKIVNGTEKSVSCDEKPVEVYEDADESEFLNEHTNTELLDMDLEDTASVYTSSMETTVTTSGGNLRRRKRRGGRSILMKSSRKSKRPVKGFSTKDDTYFCDICNKSFGTQGALAAHRATIIHISTLSKQEYNRKMEPPKDIPEPKLANEEDAATKPDITQSPVIESSSQPNVLFNQLPLSPSSVQRHLPITSPVRNQSMTYLNNIEPISSPEQHDLNYDRYTTTPRSRNNLVGHESSRLDLSQEERLFYECCSMLKGSDRSNANLSDSLNKHYTLPERSEVITKPVTPRSNEQYSYFVPDGSKHSKGIPKIDLNQFSDISSDSNPAYSCPQNPSSSETQNIFPVESKTIVDKDFNAFTRNHFDSIKKDVRQYDDRTTVIDPEYLETYSDMGDSFPSSQDVSESEQYVQTILDRSSNGAGLTSSGFHDGYIVTYNKNLEGDKKRVNLLGIALDNNEVKGFANRSPIESPLHSTSSQSSTISKPRTKAAMKGYDNYKVSIPTTVIDARHRSPNPSSCKLAALADIALGNDVPNAVGLIRSAASNNIEPSYPTSIHTTEKSVIDVTPLKLQTINKSVGNKLGFNHRKKRVVSSKTMKKSNKSHTKSPSKLLPTNQPKDVYDFEDFDDSVDTPILTLSQVRSKPLPIFNVEDENTEISSYSDRNDYNYESMSESDASVDNLQKKCLIERIFKSVKKTDVKEKEKIEPKKSIPKQELDKLFDGLRQSDKGGKEEKGKGKGETVGLSTNKRTDSKYQNERSKNRQSKKSREVANIEEELGMSMNQIVEMMGGGQRKTQRRCAINKQKTFAENWSSDEYEDFHETNDILTLIRKAEMKAKRVRNRTARYNAKRVNQQNLEKVDSQDATSNAKSKVAATNKKNVTDKENKLSVEDKKEITAKASDSDLLGESKSERRKRSHSKSTDSKVSSKKSAKVKKSKSFVESESDESDEEFDVKKVTHSTKPAKIKIRRQTISSRHDIHKSKSKGITNGTRVKQNRSSDSRDVKTKSKPISRRKRKTSDMLYYWSSSTDEEFGRIKPRDDNFNNDKLEQHGWIVGDSHKKLVTLLAHAKGKKIEDCAVKKAVHKKKS